MVSRKREDPTYQFPPVTLLDYSDSQVLAFDALVLSFTVSLHRPPEVPSDYPSGGPRITPG
jgi:hypothetical protein